MIKFRIGNHYGDFHILDWLYEYYVPVKGYEGLYEVSNWGNVRSVDRTTPDNKKIKGKRIIPHFGGRDLDYLYVGLSKNSTVKNKSVHRLVAQAFIPNPENLPQVNHKNEVKALNQVWNLEWCTVLQNLLYNDRHIKVGKKLKGRVPKNCKTVIAFENGKEIGRFYSVAECGRYFEISEGTVRDNIYGLNHIVKNRYTFCYADGSGHLSETELNEKKANAKKKFRERYSRDAILREKCHRRSKKYYERVKNELV